MENCCSGSAEPRPEPSGAEEGGLGEGLPGETGETCRTVFWWKAGLLLLSPGDCPAVSLTCLLPLELYPESCCTPLHRTCKDPPREGSRRLQGEPNKALTSQSEHRFGSPFGSLSSGFILFILFHKLLIRLSMQMTPTGDANWDSEPRTTMAFFFNCNSIAAPPPWSSALCSQSPSHRLPAASHWHGSAHSCQACVLSLPWRAG